MTKHFSLPKKGKSSLLRIFTFVLLAVTLLAFCGCKRKIDLCNYVSEYRNNLFLYKGESFAVKAQNVEKEYPYVADGYKGEMTNRTEIFISAPPNTQSCKVLFIADGMEHRGDASYDSVKRQFYYSCAADLSEAESLPIRLSFDDAEVEVTLASVKSKTTLPLKELLTKLFSEEQDLLKTMSSGKEFLGELYVRILYEDAPYFYVGVVDRSGNITAFLLDGKTGKILAKRTA